MGVSRRPSSRQRTPLVVLLSVAATILVLRWSFSSEPLPDGSDFSGSNESSSYAGTNKYAGAAADSLRGVGMRARSIAEMLVLKKQQERIAKMEGYTWQDPLNNVGAGAAGKDADNAYSTDESSSDSESSNDADPFGYGKAGMLHHFDEQDRAPSGLKLSELEEKELILQEPVRLCKECQCDVPGSYAASKAFSLPVPTVDKLRSVITKTRSFHEPALLRYLMHTILLQSTLDGTFLNENAISELLTNHYTCPDALIAFNFEGLQLDRPTSYIYTRTGPGGKLADWKDRGRYMTRQAKTINTHIDMVNRDGYLDGTKSDSRQLLWVVVEDDSSMEGKLELLLRESGIPFIYFAHGPTKHYGKAQWNIVLKAIEVLRDGFFGNGPVYNLDDDARILPVLLDKMWKVQKAVVWQVGNYPCKKFDSWWEGPIFKNGKLEAWQYAWLPDRVFPIDLNGFAINSSQIGPDLPIAPPRYIPFDRAAGETEFLEKIYSSREEVEPLCENTKEEGCYYTWHNSWLKPGWQDHPAEA